MRIKTFCKFVEVSELTPRKLRDTSVVVDASNLMYSSYREAELSSTFGIESDRFARYLSQYLTMFKKANVTCYFLFQGGHENIEQRLKKNKDNNSRVPLFIIETCQQVLNEMDFKYVVCEYENKRDIVELAAHLDCPIISFNIEYCFSGIQYIPSITLRYDEADNTIHCSYFSLATFLKKYDLTADKLAVFIVLTDEHIYPEGSFSNLLKILKAPPGPYNRNLHLLTWLSENSKEDIWKAIFKSMSTEEKQNFIEEETKARQLIERRESGGLGAACLLSDDAGRVTRADPLWFAKGVATGHIATAYINLYRSKLLLGAPTIAGFEHNNATSLALYIIQYAYDLLTNFQNDGFNFIYDTAEGKQTVHTRDTDRVSRPAYCAKVCVFENGWGEIRSLGLLEHFLKETLQVDSLSRVWSAPEEARLLFLALAYHDLCRPTAPRALPTAVLLCYVTLDVIHAKADQNNRPKFPFDKKPVLDSNTDKAAVTEADCNIGASIMEEYYNTTYTDEEHILDRELLHSLEEFQQCLLRLSELNALCGGELLTPLLARTYNGTLAYKLLRAANKATELVTFLDQLLSPAATVYAYYNGLFEVYEDIIGKWHGT